MLDPELSSKFQVTGPKRNNPRAIVYDVIGEVEEVLDHLKEVSTSEVPAPRVVM